MAVNPKAQSSEQAGQNGQNGQQPETQAAIFHDNLPAITLPKGGGAIHGIGEQFSLNAVTGTASTVIPIATSQARSSFSPKLNLTYDSGSGNGPFGLGWQLSLPFVTRKTDKGLPRYQDAEESDLFILTGAEELLPVLEPDENGFWTRTELQMRDDQNTYFDIRRYQPRVESSFSRIERWTESQNGEIHWRSISKDNTTTIFGDDENTRVFDPENPIRMFSWLVSRMFDDRGNIMKYEYKPENSEGIDLSKAHERMRSDLSRSAGRYPKRIKYGNRHSRLSTSFDLDTEHWMFEVVFDYGDHDTQTPSIHESRPWASRSDPFSTYRPTFELRTYRLCERVLMFHHFPEERNVGSDCLVSSLDLSYRDTRGEHTSASEGNSIASFISSAQHISYVRDGADYLRESLPPIEFEYSHAKISDVVRDVDPESLANLPSGLNDAKYEFLDLNGEGLSGILSRQSGAFFYKSNMGKAHFGPMESVPEIPSLFTLPGSSQQWLDLAGDGMKSLVQFDGKCPGFYKRNSNVPSGWVGFRTFISLPAIPWKDPKVKLIDLRGTGLADVLILDDEIFTYYPALAEEGFGPANFWRPSLDEDKGPRILSSDREETIFLADFSGDGLNDMVRVRNGEICYWPNLGYGAFGAKISMDNAPWFDTPDLFRQTNVHLADVDGSGTTDIVYVGHNGVSIFLNQSGNSWTNRRLIKTFPLFSNANDLQVIDLLGQGTSCLVWSSSLPSDSGRQLRYIELLSEGKPYLMTSMTNNLGSETHIKYDTSTSYYVADKVKNKPWATKLPFPVHVVSEVETLDRLNGNRFVTRHSYHEGYYDGVEREFRGFGFVESFDTEDFLVVREESLNPKPGSDFRAKNFDPTFKSPPVWTKTWYHTGAFFEDTSIMKHFRSEFYDEPGLDLDGRDALLLPETKVPSLIRHGEEYLAYELSPEEERESYRSLRGSILRQEIYSIDGTPQEAQPYQVKQHNYTIDMLQPRGPNRYAIYFTHPKEDVQFDYERVLYPISGLLLPDPRVSHTLNLVTDEYGNVLELVKLNYGRRHDEPNPLLTLGDRAKQKQILATLTLQKFTNAVMSRNSYRTPLLSESETFELVNFPKISRSSITPLIRAETVRSIIDSVATGQYDLPFEDFAGTGAIGDHAFRRRITRKRTLFRSDDLTKVLGLGELESIALSFQDYTQVFTKELAEDTFLGENRFSTGDAVDSTLEWPGGFVHSTGDDNWWSPYGKIFFSPNSGDSPVEESEYAQEHFYLPHRYRDPFYLPSFDTESFAMYDKYDLLVVETRDALGNRTTVGTRNADLTGPIDEPGYDYRLLAPLLIMDPNRNRTAAAYDILGHVTAIAVMGKPGSTEGDELSGFSLNLTVSDVSMYLNDPLKNAGKLLGNATSRMIYDLWSYHRTKTYPTPSPVMASTLSRETHVSYLVPGQETRIQQSFLYSDGFGRAIQTKSLTEPDPVTDLPRWVASGWKIFNNKGSVVRKYEPFFTKTNLYESDTRAGVSSTIFYDPLQRAVANLYPNHSWSKTRWDSWSQELWDQNDTMLIDPADDIDVSGYFRKMPEIDYFPTWYTARASGQMGTQEKVAAIKAAVSAGTPSRKYFDALGRSFLIVSHNAIQRPSAPRIEEFYTSRILLDISGNVRQTSDNLGRTVEITSYDMANKVISKASMEAGEEWMLLSVTGKPLFNWNRRGFQFATIYDQLQRPLMNKLWQFGGQESVVSRNLYGESETSPEDHNLRSRIIQSWDQATVKKFTKCDFKGNLLSATTQYPTNYSTIINWADPRSSLDPDIYQVSTTYDALNRTITITQPDRSITRTKYNLSNQIQHVDVKLNDSGNWKSVLVDEQFNARNQRVLTKHGNGVHIKYTYDQFTFSLLNMTTFEPGIKSPKSRTHHGEKFQDLHYTYDPMKNIMHTLDDAQQRIYFKNQVVDPSSSYIYDALYRLIEASGREHLGQSGAAVPYGPDNIGQIGLQSPGDGKAMGTYTESYHMDPAGNILSLRHCGNDPAHPRWTRRYKYEEPSQLQPELFSNRLTSTSVNSNVVYYHYDDNAGINGNITSMAHLSSMKWDFRDRLQSTAAQRVRNGVPEASWYTYLDDGNRARKVTNRCANDGDYPLKKSERLYLGPYEIYREYSPNGGDVSLERKTLHVMSGDYRLALIDTQTRGSPEEPEPLFRYQYTNNLDSSVLELDKQGQLISYEEYYPYGSTSYQAVRSQLSHPKRYRYTGKERDEESGFYYYGARYYAPWITRWISPDPIGTKDDVNLYAYVKCNPISKNDPTGTSGSDNKDTKKAAPAPASGPSTSGSKSSPPAAPPANAGAPPSLPAVPDVKLTMPQLQIGTAPSPPNLASGLHLVFDPTAAKPSGPSLDQIFPPIDLSPKQLLQPKPSGPLPALQLLPGISPLVNPSALGPLRTQTPPQPPAQPPPLPPSPKPFTSENGTEIKLDQPPVGVSFDTSGQGELDLQLGKDPMNFGVKIPMDDVTQSQATAQVGSDKVGAFQLSFGHQGVGGELSKDSGGLTAKLSLDLNLGGGKVQETVGFHLFSRF